jgi:replicative DNA helicase
VNEAQTIAEPALVACALMDNTVRTLAQVEPDHFQDIALRSIWDTMGGLESWDEISLADALGDRLEAVGGYAYIGELSCLLATSDNFEKYATTIRDHHLKREVASRCSQILTSSDSMTGEEMLGSVQDVAHALTASLGRPQRTLAEVVAEEHLKASEGTGDGSGLLTGTGVEKWIPGGLPLSKVTTIFADTGTFKTTLINQIMFHFAKLGYPGALFPLEDSDELNAQRWLARYSGVSYGNIAGGILTDEERAKIAAIDKEQWSQLDMITSFDGIEPKIDKILRECGALACRPCGLKWVVIDYMQLLEGRGNPKDVITEAMRKAANFAKRYKVCVIFISQQNDKWQDRKDPRPTLGDLFGSSAMKQMSKTVLALFRPVEHWSDPTGNDNHPLWGMYSKMWSRKPQLMEKIYPNIIELWLQKNVLGRKRGMIPLIAKPEVGILDPIDIKSMVS